MFLTRPRAYVDWVVPLDDQGNEICVCRDTDTYNFYLEWLADYLFHADIPVPECQQATLAEFKAKGGIHDAVFWLSDDWGLSLFQTEWIEDSYLEDLSYEDYHQKEESLWNEMSDAEREDYEDPDEEFFASEEDYNRIGREAVESKKVPAHIQHADIAYRPILAKLLKSVENKKDRIAHLDYFYRNLNECASK